MSDPATLAKVPAIVYRPPRQPFEGEVAYCNRIFVANGLGSLAAVLRTGGWDGPNRRPAFTSRVVTAAEEQLDLVATLPQTASRNRLRLGAELILNKGLLALTEVRLCPVCLREFGIVPRIGELILGTVCPIHRVRLVASCPACGTSFGWHHPRPGQCECGYDLSQVEPEDATQPEVLINAALIGRRDPDQPEVFHRIASLPLADRAALVRFIATHLLGRLPRRARLKSFPFGVIADCMQEVGAFLMNWPASIPHWSSETGAPLTRAEVFGPAWKALTGLKGRGARRFLLREFEDLYGDLYPTARDLRRGRTAVCLAHSAEFLTLAQAARAAGLGRERLRGMIRNGEVRAEKLAVGRTWIYRIPVEDVPDIRRTATAPVVRSLQDLAKVWRVSDEAVRTLYHAAETLGLSDETPSEFMAGFADLLRTNLRSRRGRRNAELMGFAEAVRRRLRRHGISLLDLALAVRAGRIGPVAETPAGGLDDFKFQRTDIDRLAVEGVEDAQT